MSPGNRKKNPEEVGADVRWGTKRRWGARGKVGIY